MLALFFLFFSPCRFLFIFSQSQCLQLQLQNPYILPAGLQAMNYLPGLKEKVTAWDQLSISVSLVSQSVSVHGFLGAHCGVTDLSVSFPLESPSRDFPGGPVFKTSPSIAGAVSSIPSRGAKILHIL